MPNLHNISTHGQRRWTTQQRTAELQTNLLEHRGTVIKN